MINGISPKEKNEGKTSGVVLNAMNKYVHTMEKAVCLPAHGFRSGSLFRKVDREGKVFLCGERLCQIPLQQLRPRSTPEGVRILR